MFADEKGPPPPPVPASRADDTRAAARAPFASLKSLVVRSLGEGSFSRVELVLLPSPRSGVGRAAALKRIKIRQTARRRASTTPTPDGDDGSSEEEEGAAGREAGGLPRAASLRLILPPTPRTAAAMLRSEHEAHERAGGCAFVAHAFALKQGRPPPTLPGADVAAAVPTTATTPAPPPPPDLALLLEYHPGGDLAQLLARRRADPAAAAAPYLDEAESRFVAACALLALEALHGGRVVHRDVKPANLFVSRQGYAVLGDLGCAAVLPKAPLVVVAAARSPPPSAAAAAASPLPPPAWCIYRGRHCSAVSGTRGYMAPEIIAGAGAGAGGARAPPGPGAAAAAAAAKTYGAAADLFSLGVALFELASGERPPVVAAAVAAGGGTTTAAAANAETAAGSRSASLEFEHLPTFPAHFSTGLRSLLGALLSRDPRLRPTAAEAMNAAWFEGASFDWAELRAMTLAPPAALLSAAAAAAGQG